MPTRQKSTALVAVLGACLVLFATGVRAQVLDATVQAEKKINDQSAQSQKRVSGLARQTQDLLTEYRSVVRETEAMKIYNDNLERVVDDQRSEIQSINRQLAELESTNRGVVPLMLDMIEALDRIVEADIPFRIEERRERVDRLRNMMDQAEVTASEKYRRVMEAYQGELEFGRTTEAYSDTLPGTEQTVDFLRVGRTLLIYQTSDNTTTGWFNPATRVFEELDDDRVRLEVNKGLAIARNEKACTDNIALCTGGPGLRCFGPDTRRTGANGQRGGAQRGKNQPGTRGAFPARTQQSAAAAGPGAARTGCREHPQRSAAVRVRPE